MIITNDVEEWYKFLTGQSIDWVSWGQNENVMANRQEYNYYKEIIKILTKSKNILMVLNVGESWFK